MKDILLPILTVLYLGFGLPVNFRINERLFSNEELIATIDESLNTHLCLDAELDPNVKIEYDIIEDFTAEEATLVESQEKGSTNDRLLATTSLYEAGAYLYQWLDEVQDFEACFRDFITPPEPSKADRSAA